MTYAIGDTPGTRGGSGGGRRTTETGTPSRKILPASVTLEGAMTRVSPTIKSYRYPTGQPYWRVHCRLPGGDVYQKKHSDELAAEKDAQRLIRLYVCASNQVQWREYELAKAIIEGSENPDLKDISLGDLVKWAAERYVNPAKLKSVAEHIEDMLALKVQQGRREDTLIELRRCLGKFERACGAIGINDFDQKVIDAFVSKQSKHASSIRRWRNHLKHFFDFLTGTSKMSPNPNPVLRKSPIVGWPGVQQDDDSVESIVILTASECEAILREAAKYNAQRMFLWLMFTGMRPFEAGRFWSDPELRWKAINLNKGVINLPGRISKKRKPRKISIRPVLRQWLEHYPESKHPTWMTSNWRDKYIWARQVLPDEKRQVPDTCRHTFISLLIEMGAPWAKIEIEVGNTKEMQMEHYAQLVEDPTDAETYWSLGPEKIGVFDVTENEWKARGRANRVRAILENKKKIAHKRNGELLVPGDRVA